MAETVIGRVKSGSRVVAKRFIRRDTIMQARFDAAAWAESEYNARKVAGKKVSGWDTMERT